MPYSSEPIRGIMADKTEISVDDPESPIRFSPYPIYHGHIVGFIGQDVQVAIGLHITNIKKRYMKTSKKLSTATLDRF